MTPLVIVGAGGHGRETLDIVEAINAVRPTFHVLGFVDDGAVDEELLARRAVGTLGPVDALRDLDSAYVLGIGDSLVHARLDEKLTSWGLEPATLVHPLASIGSDNQLGAGVVLAAGSRITTNVHLGRHTHLNIGAVVSHDCRVGDHVTLSPGALVNGNVTLGDQVFLGTAAVITPGRTIGDHTTVGAGAVVLGDVPPRVTVVGVPAHRTDGSGRSDAS